MKLKVLTYVAEYFIFVGAFVVTVFAFQQGGVYDSARKIGGLGVIIVTLWFLGAFLKYTIRKKRPEGRSMNMIMRDKYTFPSMHALTLSSASYYVFIHNTALGVVLILITVFVLIARVQTRMHYVTDMLAGCIIGVLYTAVALPYIEKIFTIFFL